MTRMFRVLPALLIAALGLVLIAQPSAQPNAFELFPHGEIRVGVDASYYPFAVATADDLFGLEIDLARAIGEKIGLPVRFVNMGFDGLFDSLRTEQVDVLISALPIDMGRIGSVHYTQPYFNAGLVLVSGGALASMPDLPGHRLAYEYGSTAESEIRLWQRRVRPFDLAPFDTPHAALDAVRQGQADAALVDAVTARLYLRDHGGWSADYHHVTDTLYALVSSGSRHVLASRLDAALGELLADGTVQALIERWL